MWFFIRNEWRPIRWGLFVTLTKYDNDALCRKNGWSDGEGGGGGGGTGIIWAKLFDNLWPGQIMFSELGDRVQCPGSVRWPVNGQAGDTITDTIAILQIHSKIQYLQLSPAGPAASVRIFLSSPPTKSAKWYFVILWHSHCDWSRDGCTPPNVRDTFYRHGVTSHVTNIQKTILFTHHTTTPQIYWHWGNHFIFCIWSHVMFSGNRERHFHWSLKLWCS